MLSLANGDIELVPIAPHGDVFFGHALVEAEEENKEGWVLEGIKSDSNPDVIYPVGREHKTDNC